MSNAKAAQGKWPGGSRPYGYLVDKTTHTLVPHETEAPILREICRLYTDRRLGTRAIADTLNRPGTPNRSGRPGSGYNIGGSSTTPPTPAPSPMPTSTSPTPTTP